MLFFCCQLLFWTYKRSIYTDQILEIIIYRDLSSSIYKVVFDHNSHKHFAYRIERAWTHQFEQTLKSLGVQVKIKTLKTKNHQ